MCEENTATNVVLYRVAASDVDTVDSVAGAATFIYSLEAGLGGEDNALFTMVNGEVRFIASPDFEVPLDANGDNVYNILVGVSDGVGPVTTKAVTIHVANLADEGLNSPPTITTIPNNPILVAENTATAFYDANFFDPDISDPVTFLPLTGADAALFNFNETTGQLSFVTPPDFENPVGSGGNNYAVTISVSDGVNPDVSQNVNIQVTNVVEAGEALPPVFSSTPPAPVSVAENSAPANILYDANAADPNGTPVVFSLDPSGDAALFSLSPAGELRFVASPNFEGPGDNNYTITINATSGGDTTQQSVNVVVTNVNEAPVFTTSPPSNPIAVAENTSGIGNPLRCQCN